ncbi:MAG TPA: hypothetical protein VJ846_10420 [Sphingomicrobium sp.]|nr:hypothetical protein [Sphingomicrobium sp.]
MIAAFVLAVARISSATDAEIAFVRDTRKIGQWSAFRKWADRDAVMFAPHAVWARSFLKRLKDPPRSISWRPAQSFVSCDGRTAVNTGPWFTQDSALGGYFTMIWQRTPTGWRWVYEGGIPTPAEKANGPKVKRASCDGEASGPPIAPPPMLGRHRTIAGPQDAGRGLSADKTLGWDWKVSARGARTLRVFLWTGGRYAKVIDALAPAPKGK